MFFGCSSLSSLAVGERCGGVLSADRHTALPAGVSGWGWHSERDKRWLTLSELSSSRQGWPTPTRHPGPGGRWCRRRRPKRRRRARGRSWTCREVQADDPRRAFGGSRGADAPMGFGGTGTPKRSWPKQALRKRTILTSRRFLSPLDTGPSRRLPHGPAPGCGSPWAAAHARRLSPAPCGPRPQGRRRGGRQACGGRCRCRGGGPCSLTEGRISARRLTKRRSLRPPRRTECAFPLHHRPGGVGRDRPPACGALWRVAQLGKRARATPRQAGGGLR